MWIQSLFKKPNRRPIRRPRTASSLDLELLEDRRVPSFSPATHFPVGTAPLSLVRADFNNDSQLDLLTVGNDTTVRVLLGNGDGTFQPEISSATGAGTVSVAVGDLNDDGSMDIVTILGGEVRVLQGNGDGTFQAPTSITVGGSASSVAVGDFNSDGALDLGVTTNVYYPGYSGYYGSFPGYYVGSVTVLLGDGDSFAASSVRPLGAGFYQAATAADLNGDSKLDLIALNYDYGIASILVGDGAGVVSTPTSFNVGVQYPAQLAVGDLNGNGSPDLAVVSQYSNRVHVALGNGLGGFGVAQSFAAGSVPTTIAIDDFNGDSLADLATTNADAGTLSVLLGTGTGVFKPPVSVANAGSSGLAVADFNGDSRPDVATANAATSNVSVHLNDGLWPALNAPSFTISDVTVAEGNAGTTTLYFSVNLSAASGVPVTVNYSTADGSATLAGNDFQAATGSLTFAPGVTSQPIAILVNGDRIAEPNETFSIRLSDPTNAFLLDATGTGTILDEEPTISFGGALTAREGNVGTTAMVFTFSLSAPSDVDVSVDFTTEDIPAGYYYDGYIAIAGDDYQAASATVTIPAGEVSRTFTVQVNGDRVYEFSEYFFLRFSNPSNAGLNSTLATVTILDDEPVVSIGSAGVTEGHRGRVNMVFPVTLSQAYDVPVTIQFATQDGTATTAGGDYFARTGSSITFAAGHITKNIVVRVNGDRLGEGYEYMMVNLSTGSTGTQVGNGTGYGTIYDDEPRLSISSNWIREGNRGTKVMKFCVTLSEPSTEFVTIRYATHDDTARARNNDYVAKSGILTFAPGQTSKTISVTIKGDKRIESEYEEFYIQLTNASSNVYVENDYAWGEIDDDDGPWAWWW